jgi:LPXTG-motif cell wall-anchored protein
MMSRTLRIKSLMVGVLALGLIAAPALAQDAPEGFTVESCGGDIALGAPEGFTLDDLPTDVSLAEICSIYGAEVLDVVEERTDAQPDDVIATLEPVEPAQVLGVTLAKTGIDAALLVLFGMALLGLGVVAIRRSGGDRADV